MQYNQPILNTNEKCIIFSYLFWLNCEVYVPDVWDRCPLEIPAQKFWTVCCDWFARTITHDHPRSPKTSATSRAISLRFSHDSNIFRSQLGRNMVVSPVWLALKTCCICLQSVNVLHVEFNKWHVTCDIHEKLASINYFHDEECMPAPPPPKTKWKHNVHN